MDNKMIAMIRECKERVNEAVRRLNEYTDGIHADSAEGISDNSGGIDELGTMASDTTASIDELATLISSQETRIETLEKEIASLKGEVS